MVKIRLSRTGTTKRPCYRIVAVDSRRRRETRVLEILGTYEPRSGGKVTLNDAAMDRWLGLGAQTSETVGALLRTRRRELSTAASA
jgi:small subunit ribosomal protein S16